MKEKLSKIKRIYWIIGGVVLVVAIVALVIWNMSSGRARAGAQFQTYTVKRTTLMQSIGGTGSVHARQSALLTWGTSGQVGTVNAQIGDAVTSGQELATLEQASLPQSVIQAAVDLVTAQNDLASAAVSNTGLATAEQAVATAQQTLQTAQNKLDSMSYPRASDAVIQNAYAKIQLDQRRLADAQLTYRFYINRADKNPDKAQALYNMTNAQIAVNTDIATYNWYTGKPTALDLVQAQAARDVAKAQLDDAQRNLDTYKTSAVSPDVAAAQAKVAIAQSTLNQARILAPFTGMITAADANVGDLVTSGTQAFRIDNTAHLLVDVQVSEVDINKIKVDMPITVQFDAISGKTYNGKVVKVNLAGDTSSNAVTFTVTTELTDADELVKPGMSATVSIIVEKKDNALVVPNRAISTRNGKHYVRVLSGGAPAEIEVQIGTVTDTVTEITGGDLQEGDLIALTTSTTTTSTRTGGGGFGGGVRIP